jgi:hypothetical protein
VQAGVDDPFGKVGTLQTRTDPFKYPAAMATPVCTPMKGPLEVTGGRWEHVEISVLDASLAPPLPNFQGASTPCTPGIQTGVADQTLGGTSTSMTQLIPPGTEHGVYGACLSTPGTAHLCVGFHERIERYSSIHSF